jgi:hypothetical protein
MTTIETPHMQLTASRGNQQVSFTAPVCPLQVV